MSPIFILGAHKSGTSLLRSLLDGHQNLAVIPFETHIAKHLGGWVDYPYQHNFPESFDLEKFKASTINWIHEVNLNKDPYSDKDLSLQLNESLFQSMINKISSNKKSEIVEEYLRAAYASSNSLVGNKEIVEKSVENHEYAIDLKQIFPAARFIHIVRNPYANILSLRKHKGGNGYPALEPIVSAIKSSFYYLYRNRDVLREYFIIRYEDLVCNPRKVMSGLCKKLNISFNDGLLNPTSAGRLWEGNSVTNKKFKSISQERIDFDINQLAAIEIELINKYVGPVLSAFNYEHLSATGTVYAINKSESPRTYLRNRCLLNRQFIT